MHQLERVPSLPSLRPTADGLTTALAAALLGATLLAGPAYAGSETAVATTAPNTATAAATAAPAAPAPPAMSDAERSLWRSEEGFAGSFAARDPDKFASFLGDDVIFAGSKRMLHGRQEVREVWTKMMMDGPTAPFTWRPTRAMVSGDVGMTSGPVYDTEGKWAGSFTSVWRRQADGTWRIVLDGAPPCGAPPAGQ